MTFEQMIAIGAISGAFGGAGAYGLNLIITSAIARIERKRARKEFERYFSDPANVEALKSSLRRAAEDVTAAIERGEIQ